jgi:hypothetical protein
VIEAAHRAADVGSAALVTPDAVRQQVLAAAGGLSHAEAPVVAVPAPSEAPPRGTSRDTFSTPGPPL